MHGSQSSGGGPENPFTLLLFAPLTDLEAENLIDSSYSLSLNKQDASLFSKNLRYLTKFSVCNLVLILSSGTVSVAAVAPEYLCYFDQIGQKFTSCESA